MKTRVAIWFAVALSASACVQVPVAREGASAGVTGRDWASEVRAAGAGGALMIGERALARTSLERPVLTYRFRSTNIWVVDVTAIAVDGGDPVVAILGPLAADGELPLLADSDASRGPLERLTGADLEYDREYLAVVSGAPGLLVETQITVTAGEPLSFELPTFVLGEPTASESPSAAWERACAAEEARLRAELGVNRLAGFDCGTPEAFDAGGVSALASTAVARFSTSWPAFPGRQLTAVIGQTSTDRRQAFESHRERCQGAIDDTRRTLGGAYAGAACAAPRTVFANGLYRTDAAVTYFVFERE